MILLIISPHEYKIEVIECDFELIESRETLYAINKLRNSNFFLVEKKTYIGPKGSIALTLSIPVDFEMYYDPFKIVDYLIIGELVFKILFYDAVIKNNLTLSFKTNVIIEGSDCEPF